MQTMICNFYFYHVPFCFCFFISQTQSFFQAHTKIHLLGLLYYFRFIFISQFFYFFYLSVSGRISNSKWCEAMEAATNLGLPWRMLREKLAPPDPKTPENEIVYNKTLELLDTDCIVSVICVFFLL